MDLGLRPPGECRFDAVSLGEIMLRLDPGEGRIRTARSFRVWEGGGEYNEIRGLHKCFRMNTAVTPELIEEINPHTVINAIGAVPIIPDIPGKDKDFVVDSHDVLDGNVSVNGNVVVIGGGMVGMETAEYLAGKGAKDWLL